MAVVRGSVVTQVAGIELLARYSLNSLRHTSVLSDLEEFRDQERGSVTDKEWNWRILRDQFQQKDLEILYKKFNDKLRLSYLSMFLILQFIISLIHILTLVFLTDVTNINGIIALSCYCLQIILPVPILLVGFSKKLSQTFPWYNLAASIFVLIILFSADVLVVILNQSPYPLRLAYSTQNLLACYVFLPILNNYVALAIGSSISIGYLVVLGMVTYVGDTIVYQKLGADLLYFIGVNSIGIYYRLMNEVVSRRSFLDRRACVETTFKLNFEKEQEEKLMLSILPEHIASVVRQDIRKIFLKIQSDDQGASSQTFNHLYIKEHKNVSILYADVVNYTMLTTKLKPRVLVETLNDLFGKFDKASQEHNVLRIKFLGDCYYCVSGVPEPNPRHAKSCVDLGLDMISIIGEVRKGLDINMRIGVHTGNIMSGIIGIKKWQFDIWSKDVTIANKMESTGKPGKVHITKRTLEELSDSASGYIIEPNFEARNDPFLAKHKIETFLVTNMPRRSSVRFRRISVNNKNNRDGPRTSAGLGRRTTTFMGTNLIAYNQMLKAADAQMKRVIDEMPTGIISEYIREDSISPWTMLYRNSSWEKSYVTKPDPLFKYFILVSLFILMLMVGIQALTIEVLLWRTMVIDGMLAIILIFMQPVNWTQYFYARYHGSDEPTNQIALFFYKQSNSIVWSSTVRTVLYFVVSFMLAVSAVINLSDCDANLSYTTSSVLIYLNCIAPWHLAQACSLALLISSLFSRVRFLFKWSMGVALAGIFLWLVWGIKSEVFEHGNTWNYELDPRVAHTMFIVFLTFTLHLTDRQTEYRNRLDHKWKRQLTEEQDEAYTMKLVNNMLLQNILPAHVADIYLNHRLTSDELYHEEYSNVAVMFASLTDYKLGIDDDDEVPEKTMLKILDQLISDFDKLLLCENTKRLKVEKIKMAGWTYMAACGLEPGRRDSRSSVSSHFGLTRANQSYEDDVVLTMLEFAAAMMVELRAFNKNSFQGTNLKIGISHGEVTAGVVGSLKPLYDIWGNAVNMASRMDSTGEAGKIQVTENTAIAIDRQGVLTQYRGKTFVKGAGYVRTYYVPLDKDFNLIMKDTPGPTSLDFREEDEESEVTRC